MATVNELGRAGRILVVDDNPADIELTRLAFGKALSSATISSSSSAEAALSLLTEMDIAGSKEMPDLIISDLNLPRMNGFDFLSELKAHSALRKIPVIIMSSSSRSSDIDSAYEGHASGYISKPWDLGEFTTIAKNLSHYWFGTLHSPLSHEVNTPARST